MPAYPIGRPVHGVRVGARMAAGSPAWAFPGGKWVYRVVAAKGRRPRLADEGRGVKAAWHRACERALGGPRSGG